MSKKLKNILLIVVSLILFCSTTINAHKTNITGGNNEDSTDITEYNGKFYGFHNENGVRHYHEVEWNEENQSWEIINPAVYYDENFDMLDNYKDIETEKINVTYYASVDGDTAKFILNDEIITVRFLGIDTPETVHTQKEEQPYGKEASNYTKEKLENATKIEIEYDAKAQEKDKYDRILAWVWIDDKLLQEELVANGLARTYMLQNNYRYASTLQLAESEAKNQKIGIWNSEETDNNTINNDDEKNITNIEVIGLIITMICGIVILIIGKKKSKEKVKK